MIYQTEIVDNIIEDLKNRAGFDSIWNSLDENIKSEIRQAWIDIAVKLPSKVSYSSSVHISNWKPKQVRKDYVDCCECCHTSSQHLNGEFDCQECPCQGYTWPS